MTEETLLRDTLAAERTHLANERTLLAYVRTALAFAVTGLGLIKFFPATFSAISGWILIWTAIAVALIGVVRFRMTAMRLRARQNGTG